jgi:hypothetical protein
MISKEDRDSILKNRPEDYSWIMHFERRFTITKLYPNLFEKKTDGRDEWYEKKKKEET